MSNDTFQLLCQNCGSKLTAKVALLGQTRNCPKCKTPVLIQRDEPAESPASMASSEQRVEGAMLDIVFSEPSIAPPQTGPSLNDGVGRIENLPERLLFRNRYFVLSADRLIATWESGKGWQINIGSGFSPAKKCADAIPDQGTFQLVELVIEAPGEETTVGGVPSSVNVFKISVRGALTALYRDEDSILERVDCPGELSKQQKNLLLNHLRQIYMFDILAQSKELMAFLASETLA